MDLKDNSAVAGPNSDYVDKGEYKIHCDAPFLPSNEFCFNSTKIDNYAASNEEVGRSDKYLGRVKTFPKRNLDILIGTFIAPRNLYLGVGKGAVTREHVTLHYYAQPFLVPIITKVKPNKI